MMKSLEIRSLEARGRARHLGVRVREIRRGREYVSRSQSDATVTYRIARTADGWACGCTGYEMTGLCKHIGQVERRAEREGWAFGRVARHDTPRPLTTLGLHLLTGGALGSAD